MIALGLILSIALPLLAGMPWLIAHRDLERGSGTWPLALAYGYVLGLLIVVAGLRLLDLVNVPANLWTAAALPALVAILGWKRLRQGLQFAKADAGLARRTWRDLSRTSRVVCIGALALVALRMITLGSEIIVRPIFPWEAVSAVAAKARTWYELGNIASFVSPAALLQGLGSFTDTDPGASALPSLLMVWTAHMTGQWHEGTVGFPWWMLGLGVVLALYGHLRRTGAGLAFSLVFAYVFVSLPLVDLHIVLAGAPQWIAAAGVGLAGCAFLRWLQTPSRELLYLILIGSALALFSMISTWPWFVVFGVSAAIARWPKYARKLAIGVPLLVLFGLLAWQQTPVKWRGTSLQLQVVPAWGETVESLFLLDNWHLLYGTAILLAILGWRLITRPEWLARTWMIGMGTAVLFIWGALSVQGLWFGGLRDFSYAALQFAAPLVMWVAIVARSLATTVQYEEALPAQTAPMHAETAPSSAAPAVEVPAVSPPITAAAMTVPVEGAPAPAPVPPTSQAG